jgi:amidohydrolase
MRPHVLALCFLTVVASTPAARTADRSLAERIDAAVAKHQAAAIELRHKIHQNPELGYQEKETAALVADHLRKLGLEVRTEVAITGVVGVLRGGKPGPVVAYRADMDALPVTENTDLPFKSTKRGEYLGQAVGIAHACGHDVHTSVGLGVASVLAEVRAELPGTVLFLFQPAEEGPPPGLETGAKLMLDEGAFRDPKPDMIFALHAFHDLPVGTVGANPGATMASVDQFVAKIRGKQSHGAYPHLGIDPVVMASQAILALQTIRSRNLPADAPSVVTVGIVRGGERFNIIPDEVHLEGTVRTYDEGVRKMIERRMHEILGGVTQAGGGTYELDYKVNAPVTVNDPALTEKARGALRRALGDDKVVAVQPTMGGEDYAYFANVVPGFYFRLGIVAPGTTSGAIHTPNFRADDSAVPVGMKAAARLVAEALSGW